METLYQTGTLAFSLDSMTISPGSLTLHKARKMAEDKKEEKTRTISLEEVKKHKGASSCWIIIHDKVYDVTRFLDEHPGGEEVLLEQAGSDGTESFEDVGHSSDAREIQEKYLIGELAEEDRTTASTKSKSTVYPVEGEESSSWFNTVLMAATVAAVGAVLAYKFVVPH